MKAVSKAIWLVAQWAVLTELQSVVSKAVQLVELMVDPMVDVMGLLLVGPSVEQMVARLVEPMVDMLER